MPFCSRCGVEVEPAVSACPLCERRIQTEEIISETAVRNYPDSVISTVASELKAVVEKKNHVWELLSIFLLVSMISVIAIDLSFHNEITWSFYPIAAVLGIWSSFTAGFFIRKHLIVLLVSDCIFLLLFLFFIDYYAGDPMWFFPIALPSVGLLIVISILLFLSVSGIKKKGLNIAGFFLIAVSIFCLGLENILTVYFYGRPGFSWSLIVSFSLIPIAAFLIYLHYRFTSRKNLKGLFHV